MIGRRLGPYRVLEELASGGMGDVYVAEDTRLDRRVALKVPRQGVVDSIDSRVRLRREAKAAAALNHPNIVHLYSVEDYEDVLFITMELVQGQSLRDLLSPRQPLPLARTLSFAAQLADGLACAHAAGVLHRDLKPGNVVVAKDDRLKILDFGLAKLFTPASLWDPEATTMARDASSAGLTLGTAGYMSPEQALGRPVDARTDLFALGVVLFEMATGRAPFEADTPAGIFDRLLNRRHASPCELNPALPSALAAIIDRALEKDAERRYGSAADLLDDLRRVDAGTTTRAASGAARAPGASLPSSIVVLPFADLSPAKDQEYFCHGITEEIISALTRVPGLRVISRTSAFAFQGKDLPVTQICASLRVGAALEGSVRKAGGRVRVTVQLVGADDGAQRWSTRFDRELADVFAIQDEIAATVLRELQGGVGGLPTPKNVANNLDALDAYLRGMYARNKWTEPAMRQAIADFGDAIARDPACAAAHVALAEGHLWFYSSLGVLAAREAVPPARAAVETALALDPMLADAHRVHALIAMNHDWDRHGADAALSRAIELGPGSASAHLWNAWRLALLERQHDRALVELEAAERLDPLDLQIKTQIGYVHCFHHDFDRAVEQFERVLALEPSFAFAHYALGDVCTHTGHYDRAFAAFERAIALGGRSANHVGVLGYAHGLAGHRDQAETLLGELLARASHGYVSAMWIALVYLGLGDVDGLFHWLDRAFAERDGSLILITAAVEFDPVRADPRFKALLGRMGLGHLALLPA